MFYKRKVLALLLAITAMLSCIGGCKSAIPPLSEDDLSPPPSVQVPPDLNPPSEIMKPSNDGSSDVKPEVESPSQPDDNTSDGGADDKPDEFVGMSVHYLDVGQGDCILICFPDGKSLMIDCGNGSAGSTNTIISALKAKEINSLDYLVLTHPDSDHIGSVKDALNEVAVKKVFHPDVSEQKTGFDRYFDALSFLKDKGAETKISLQGECIAGEDYKVCFLAPKQRRQSGSSYGEFHLAIEPTESQINNLSPYIYLEYKEYRFLFTGDADKDSEVKLLNDYDSSWLKNAFSKHNVEINLEEIDFLKVSHHGSNDASSKDFLSLLKAKNAIISVGGDNIHGHPATSTQKRLIDANGSVNILRTDVSGTVSVFINNLGTLAVTTQNQSK